MQRRKRTIFWVIPIAIIGVFFYFYGPKSDITDNEYINYIQQVSLVEDSNLTIHDALNNYCEKSEWIFFKTQREERVVEFKGECPVEQDVKPVNFQFIVNKDITEHDLGVLLLNHVQQTEEDREKFINLVYSK